MKGGSAPLHEFGENVDNYQEGVLKLSKDAGLGSILRNLDSAFRVQPAHRLGPFVNWAGNSTTPLHCWYRYREAFSPRLIDELDLGRRLLDPFCGCGSIVVGAAKRAKVATGIDLNPLAVFATKVKLQVLSISQLAKVKRISKELEQLLAVVQPSPIPELSISEKVFEPEILDKVLRTKSLVDSIGQDDSCVGDFLKLCWLSVFEEVGSYFKEGNGIKYRNKKRAKGKYVSRLEGEWQKERFGDNLSTFFIDALRRKLDLMIEDASAWEEGHWSRQKVIEGSALDMRSLVGRRRFDSIIFSPPYANRFDYFESFKVELWFGGFVNSYEEMRQLRKASLRSHLAADYSTRFEEFPELEALLERMDKSASSWRMGVADLMRGYFDDMRRIIKQCRALCTRGSTSVVVGNSAFAGVIIPTDVLIGRLGLQAGFSKVEIYEARHLTVSPQQRAILTGLEDYMRESVVVLS